MKKRKIPLRTCIGCRSQREKKDLIRVVKDNENNIFIDESGRANGRGAYICRDVECLEKAIKSKALNRSFKTEIKEETYESLKNSIK